LLDDGLYVSELLWIRNCCLKKWGCIIERGFQDCSLDEIMNIKSMFINMNGCDKNFVSDEEDEDKNNKPLEKTFELVLGCDCDCNKFM
jgi:hypothetical protein